MAEIQDYELLVSGIGGTVYIAKKTKTPHVMSSTRKKIEEGEFINVLLNWVTHKIEDDNDTLYITNEAGDVTAEIVIRDKSILRK